MQPSAATLVTCKFGSKGQPDVCSCCCADRVIELSKAFDEEDFDKFDRKRVPKVLVSPV